MVSKTSSRRQERAITRTMDSFLPCQNAQDKVSFSHFTSKNQSRDLRRMQKKAKDRADLDFCKENRDNIDYIRKQSDILTFCREHRDKIDELMYLTELVEGMPLQ